MGKKLTISEVVNEARRVASDSVPTLYVLGGWGQRLTYAMKSHFISYYAFNARDDRRAKILGAGDDTIAVDCVCGVKSIWDSLVGVNDQNGKRTPCPDIDIKNILTNHCKNVKILTNGEQPAVGDFLAFGNYSHCGLYLGNGEVFEVTYAWKDGAQITTLEQRKGQWVYAGTPEYYSDEEPTPEPQGWYVCQCASYANKDAAIKGAKSVKNASTYQGSNGYYAVAIGRYNTKAEAAAHLDEAKKQRSDAFVNYFKKEQLIYDGSVTPTPAPAPVVTVPAVQVMAQRTLALAEKYKRNGQHIYKVGAWYKTAYTYASDAEARAALPTVRKTYKDAFVTSYKSDQIIE